MADDDRVRLRADLAGIVERRQPDVLAGKVGSRDVMTAILEFLDEPAEAPAPVPGSVHENEPCHRASIHHSLLGSGMPPAPERSGNSMSAGIPVTGVSELVLEVLDLEYAERFYADVLGFPVVELWDEGGRVWVMAGTRTRIGLWRPQVGIAKARGGLHVHYAMQIDDADFDAAVERLRG